MYRLILALSCCYNIGLGQSLYDAQWVLGYDTSSIVYGGDAILLNFQEDTLLVSSISTVDGFSMEGANTSMSDKNGNLLFYTNGCYIVNREHQLMENGDVLTPGIIEDIYCPVGGNPISQSIIALPQPDKEFLYYVFNSDLISGVYESPNLSLAPLNLYYHIVDMSMSGGLGTVIQKNIPVIQDTLGRGMITATQHANSKDWWIIMPESHSNCYYLIALTKNGIENTKKICEGHIWDDNDGGQAKFSPDGKKYVRFNSQNGLHIMDFDSELGELSNPSMTQFPNDTFPTNSGVSISPSSKFLYASARKKLYQFELSAEDIESSKITVAVWDGFSNPYPTIFHSSSLAPNGKIYIASSSSHLNLHVM